MTVDENRRKRILLVLFAGVLMGALDIAIVGPSLPAIKSTFGLNDRASAWIFAIYVLFNLAGTPLMAKLSDAYGRRAIYALDISLFALGSLAVVVAPSFPILLAGRAIQGLGAGGIFPVASAVIGDTMPPERRGKVLGLFGAVFGLAFLIGPVVGGVLLSFGWRWLFIINLPIAAAVLVMSLSLLPSTRPAMRRTLDLAGMSTLTVLLASLAYGVNQIDAANVVPSLSSASVWPFLILALVLLAPFLAIEMRAADPVLRLRLYSSRQVAIASVLAGGAGLSEAAIVFVPSLLVAAYNVSFSEASYMLLPAVLAMAAGSPLAGWMLDRRGSRVVILLGSALLAAGLILVSGFATNIFLFYVSAILVGFGISILLGAPLRYIMLSEARSDERAAAQGVLTLFNSTGQLVSGVLVGAVAASMGGGVGGYEGAFLAVGFVALALFFLSFGLKSRAEELETAKRNEQTRSPAPEAATSAARGEGVAAGS